MIGSATDDQDAGPFPGDEPEREEEEPRRLGALPPGALRVREVARRWGTSTTAVRRLIDDGELHSVRSSTGVVERVLVVEVERYEGEHGRPSRQPSRGQLREV